MNRLPPDRLWLLPILEWYHGLLARITDGHSSLCGLEDAERAVLWCAMRKWVIVRGVDWRGIVAKVVKDQFMVWTGGDSM